MKFLKTILMLAALALACGSAQAQFNSASFRTGTFSDVPASVVGSTSSNVLSSITLGRNQGVAILPYFAGTNAATVGTLKLVWKVSVDNTNWSSPVYTNEFTATGATAVRPYAFIPASVLSNVRYLQLATIADTNSDATNRLFLTNVTWSIVN